MTGELISWFRAQVDEDERKADAIENASWMHGVESDAEAEILHFADPDRIRREVDAKRKLIDRYERVAAASTSLVSFTRGQDDGYRQACLDAIRDAAEVYAARPGYRKEWTLEL